MHSLSTYDYNICFPSNCIPVEHLYEYYIKRHRNVTNQIIDGSTECVEHLQFMG